jgi:VCBS repeat-containing protein
MNRICVLKDVDYAAKVGGGVIASIKEVNLLVPGALAFFNSKGTLLTAANAAANVADIKEITIASGRALDNQIINQVPRKLSDINLGVYRAFTKPVVTVGVLSIGAADEGEISVRVSDTSYTSKFNIRTASGSYYKKATTSISDAVDAVVAKLNKPESFIVATKTGTTPNFSITITPKENGVTISAALSGLVEGDPITTTTPMVYGIGEGTDILQTEKDFSVEEGNGNYIDYTTEWYKRNMEAVASANYDVITLSWEGTHTSPTRTHNVMRNRVVIATLTNATANDALGQDDANLMAIIALIFGNAYTTTAGAEIATDDGTDQDGVSGN